MRDRSEQTPYPFPPEGRAFEPFPAAIPWDTAIHELSNWWLRIECECGISCMPLRLLAARIGWDHTLRAIVPKLRCPKCRLRPSLVDLESDPGGDIGRAGHKVQRHRLWLGVLLSEAGT